jgi:hypothetical protein
MRATLPDFRNWYYVECLEADDGEPDGENHVLVKFFSPDGIQTVHGERVHYEYSRIETFNFDDYADKPEPLTIESRLNIVEWEITGIKNLVKELKKRLTSLESGV